MNGKLNRIRSIGIAIVVAACVTQPALAYDGRSPDTREAAEETRLRAVVDARSPDTRGVVESAKRASFLDARSPDTRDSAVQALPETTLARTSLIDRRSPDTRDAAAGIGQPFFVAGAPNGFDWRAAGIGAGGALALMLLLLATKQMIAVRMSGSAPRAQVSA